MKAALAQFIFESNTFAPEPAHIDVFKKGGVWLDTEDDVRAWAAGTDSQMHGSLDVLEAAGWETAPCFTALCGSPAGRLTEACFHEIRDTLLARVKAAGPFDVLILHLHGAACAVGEDDTEGHILEKVRTELGYSGRLVLSLDLHANFTRRMLEYADAVTAYRTFPHMDFSATGERAARLALHPGLFSRAVAKIAALMPPADSTHFEGNFCEIIDRARQLERETGVVEVCSLPVQPWMDIDEMGTSVVVTATSADGVPLTKLENLAQQWYDQRHAWKSRLTDWPTILTRLERVNKDGPWVLNDAADATAGGSLGHSAEALRRLLPRKDDLPGKVLLWVVDPDTVQAARDGATHFTTGDPAVEWEGRVLWTGEGNYRARGKAYTGQAFSMGEAAVIEAGQLQLVACSYPALTPDPAFYECVGLAPDDALAVLTKSIRGWMPAYDAGWERGLLFDGPGVCSMDFASIPFTGSARGLFPVTSEPEHPIEIWMAHS
jgi:microcystin degradation protein MlrC